LDWGSASDGTYTLDLVWDADETVSGKLYSIQWDETGTGPVTFLGYAEKAITINDGGVIGNEDGSVAATNLALSDPGQRTLNGTLTGPNGMDPTIRLYVGDEWFSWDVTPPDFSCFVPEAVSLPMSVYAHSFINGHGTERRRPVPATGDLDLVLPEPAIPFCQSTPPPESRWRLPSAGHLLRPRQLPG